MEIVLDKLARQFQCQGHKPIVVAQRSRHNTEIPPLPYEVIYYPRPRSAVWLLQYVKHVLIREHKRYHFVIIHFHRFTLFKANKGIYQKNPYPFFTHWIKNSIF